MRPPDHNPLIGESAPFQAMLEQVSRVAPLDRPVLIIGERGTGKELISARVHFLSRRWERPYVRMNCAALTESLLETELFGHEAGAFTGATRRHTGRFELANDGTLFLDEVANTSLRLQEKILRVVEYGEFERVGATVTTRVDVRIVGATNVDLPAWARAGKFREDLLDRLAFDVITVPPLRVRGEDVLLLAEHFGVAMARALGAELFPGFAPAVREQLLAWPWPGNVRELKNVVERATYKWLPSDQPIGAIDFDPFDSPWRPRGLPSGGEEKNKAEEPAANSPDTGAVPDDFRTAVREFESGLLQRALAGNLFNQRRTAEALGLGYHQLRALLKKHGLNPAAQPDRH